MNKYQINNYKEKIKIIFFCIDTKCDAQLKLANTKLLIIKLTNTKLLIIKKKILY